MSESTERRKSSLEQRLADAYEFIEDPGNWSALDGRRALLMQILRPNGAEAEAANENPTPEEFGKAIHAERQRQIAKGYDAAHDREHGLKHLLNWAIDYARQGKTVESAALILAALEQVTDPAEIPSMIDKPSNSGESGSYNVQIPTDEGALRERLHDAMQHAHYEGRGDYGDEGEGYNHGDEVEAFMAHPDFVAWLAIELQKARAEAWSNGYNSGWTDCVLSRKPEGVVFTRNPFRSQEPPTGSAQ